MGMVSVALASENAPIWTVNAEAFPRLSPGTLALCSSDFPLAPWPATILSDITRSVKAKACTRQASGRWCRRGDLNSHGRMPTTP